MHARELKVSYAEGVPEHGEMVIKNGRDAAILMAPLLEPEVVEVCYALLLTTKLTVIAYHQVSRGSLNQSPIHPRDVYLAAILANAASIVLVHNHPSGEPTPSSDDVVATTRLRKAGQLLGIELLDHVIIGHHGRYVSLRELGRF